MRIGVYRGDNVYCGVVTETGTLPTWNSLSGIAAAVLRYAFPAFRYFHIHEFCDCRKIQVAIQKFKDQDI